MDSADRDARRRAFGVLVNPEAGIRSVAVADEVAAKLRSRRCEVTVDRVSDHHRTEQLVAALLASEKVVTVVGGDGTLASVIGPIHAAEAELAIIAAGRGNDFARMLTLPRSIDDSVDMLLNGPTRTVDLLAATFSTGDSSTTRLVAGSVYAGVDARAGAMVLNSRVIRRFPAQLQYPAAGLAALSTYRPMLARLEVDGQVSRHRAATIVVANSAYYGKGMKIAPAADVSDGELDIVVVEATSRAELIRSLPKLYRGSHDQMDQVTMLRGSKVRLTGSSIGGGHITVGADGEDLTTLPGPGAPALEIAVAPRALRIITV